MSKININKIIYPKSDNTISVDICTRAKVDTGYKCNYKCDFCYYLNNLNDKTKDIKTIKEEIDLYVSRGITEFDLSGGESSIHPDIFEIIKYCKYHGNVSLLSNGSMFNSMDFLQECKNNGLGEILFSLHGWNQEQHDKKVQHKGAFKKIIKAINNCHKLNIKVRINCTVQNDFDPDAYHALIETLNPYQLNFLPLNYWNDAKALKSIDYQLISKKLMIFIDKDHNSKKYEINIRYIPFCFLKGYEKYIVGIYQHIYDKGDWNLDVYESKELYKTTKETMFKTAKKNRISSFTKPPECINCKYIYICDGIEPNINCKLFPESGERITDVNYYKTR